MSRCVILSAAPVTDPAAQRGLLQPGDWFVAADGGLRLAQALGVHPAAVVADFDSGQEPEEDGLEIIRYPVEKDVTDTQAAAMLALERGYRDFLLLGCTGGRLDHTMGNLSVLLYILRRGGSALLADEDNRVRLLAPGDYTVPAEKGFHLSLVPFGGDVRGVTLRHVKYPLADAVLSEEETLGISNEFLDCPAQISFREGRLLLFFSRD